MPGELVTEAPQSIVPVVDREWTRVWEDQFQPMQMGRRLWICPSWTPPPDPNAINLLLDPGLAFGTGTHPTTAMCIKALDAAELDNARVVDYGCGSGILGIAAGLLGAQRVLGIDNDPQAISASLDNAARNHVSKTRFSASLPDPAVLEHWHSSADWVVANILAGPLIELVPALTSLLVANGRLLLAGLLEEQAEQIITAYAPEVTLAIADQQEGGCYWQVSVARPEAHCAIDQQDEWIAVEPKTRPGDLTSRKGILLDNATGIKNCSRALALSEQLP